MYGDLRLQSILNDAANLLASGAVTFEKADLKPMSELEAFASLDPLLSSLRKEYLDAKSQRAQALREYGAGDAMSEMAEWAEDSAWCAMQTRYMELRADRVMMAQAQVIMHESLEEYRALETRAKQKEAVRCAEQLLLFQKMRDVKEENKSSLWLLMLFLLTDQNSFFRSYQPAHAFRMAA